MQREGGGKWAARASPPAALLTLTIRAHNQAHMIKNRSRCVLVTHLISWVFINHNTNHDGNTVLQLCRLSCSVLPTNCCSRFLFKFDLESYYVKSPGKFIFLILTLHETFQFQKSFSSCLSCDEQFSGR